MLATYPFNGQMNLDDPDLVLPSGMHRMARNGIFRGSQGRMRFESILGTNLVANSFLPNTGVNVTQGVYYDAVNQRVFFFNYNSAGNSGIYIYYTLTKTFVRLVQDGVNTQGVILGITATERITSIDILYGDGISGDLLFYIDSQLNCRKLNINRLLAGTYSTIKSNYLNVIKAPPIPPIQAVYENDNTVASNNCVNSLFNFTCTHIYDDFEQSVLASGAKQPLPSDPFNPLNNTPAKRNARIALYIPTGDVNVQKLRIYAKQTQYGATTDWFIVDTLDKTLLNIPSNTVYRYLFYNNGNYTASDPTFTVLDYDYVPQSANSQALLDGNVIGYGGITEGYNFINPTFSIATSSVNFPIYSLNGTLFFAALNGVLSSTQPQFNVYLTGVGVNDGFGNPTTLEKVPETVTVRAKSNGADVSFSFTNSGSNPSIPFILAGIGTAATVAGWTVVSTSSNYITIYYPTGTVVLQSSYINGIAIDQSPYPSPICCHFPQSTYSYGVLYRDQNGRTNGTISNVTGNLLTQATGTSNEIPLVSINLSAFQPPPWAAYWELVRTDTLTYNKYLNWVSNAAYQGTGAGVNTQYAYFGISNIETYNQSISATQGIVGYTFTQGDRIKILGRYDSSMNFTPLNLDYAILGTATNPVANGIFQNGNFIQIYYPTADISGNFQFPIVSNDTNFQNYLILIYSYKPYSTTSQNVYYQIGQQYGVGNPGSNTAYHMGNIADNQVSLTDADVFFRPRTVPLQNSYFVPTGSYPQGTTYSTEWVNPGGNNTPIVDNGIWSIIGDVHQNAGLGATQFPNYSNTGWDVYNESGSDAFSVRLRGTQTIVDATDPNGQFSKYVKVVQPGNVITVTQIVPLQTGLQPNISATVTFDSTIQLPPGAKLWIINYAVNQIDVGGYNLEIDIIRNININAFDKSYSDIYELATNADNKPNVINVEAAITYYSTLFRFSQPDELGTDINNSNRFYPDNFDEFDKSYGDIIRLRIRQREMRVFQKRRCGRVGVYQKFITNQSANTSLVVSDTIITPNNIQYFEGEWGIGNQASSLCSSGYVDYFADPVKGYLCRLSLDGIIPISELYKAQTWAGNNLPVYLNQYNYQFGGSSVILGVFNFLKDRDSEALFSLQGGTQGSATIPAQTLAFTEKTNSFSYFVDAAPDSIICAENLLISFYNGNLYTHDNSTTYANWYGQQLTTSITGVYKDPVIEKKTFESITEVSNVIWESPLIYTNVNSYAQQRQESNLVVEDFVLLDPDYYAAFWNDIHSQQGIIDGDNLKGNLIVIQLNPADSSQFGYLSDISIKFIDSPMTNR